MCGRFTLTTNDYEAVAQALGAELVATAEPARPRYNVAPGDLHPIVWLDDGGAQPRRRMQSAIWGMPGRDDERLHINARSETVHTKPAFRDALFGARCLVAADGFYEWSGPSNHRLPVWFHRPGTALLTFAGIYRDVVDAHTGEVQRRFAILTTQASGPVAAVHDRMPVILDAPACARWLAPPPRDVHTWPAVLQRLAPVLAPAPDDLLLATECSDRANKVGNDDPSCIVAHRHPRQQTLF